MSDTSTDVVPLERCAHLEIRNDTPKGRGVFATSHIAAKTVIDVCPVLVLGMRENAEFIRKTSLFHYTYNWPSTDDQGKVQTAQAVVFGLGSMFNHSTQEQNVVWQRDHGRLVIIYRAARDIRAGEELCISYGSHLTFVDADTPIPPAPDEEIHQLIQIHLD